MKPLNLIPRNINELVYILLANHAYPPVFYINYTGVLYHNRQVSQGDLSILFPEEPFMK